MLQILTHQEKKISNQPWNLHVRKNVVYAICSYSYNMKQIIKLISQKMNLITSYSLYLAIYLCVLCFLFTSVLIAVKSDLLFLLDIENIIFISWISDFWKYKRMKESTIAKSFKNNKIFLRAQCDIALTLKRPIWEFILLNVKKEQNRKNNIKIKNK